MLNTERSDLIKRRAQKDRAEVIEFERQKAGLSTDTAAEPSHPEPVQEVLHEIRELRREIKDLREDIRGLRGKSTQTSTDTPTRGTPNEKAFFVRDGKLYSRVTPIDGEPAAGLPSEADRPWVEPRSPNVPLYDESQIFAAPPSEPKPSGAPGLPPSSTHRDDDHSHDAHSHDDFSHDAHSHDSGRPAFQPVPQRDTKQRLDGEPLPESSSSKDSPADSRNTWQTPQERSATPPRASGMPSKIAPKSQPEPSNALTDDTAASPAGPTSYYGMKDGKPDRSRKYTFVPAAPPRESPGRQPATPQNSLSDRAAKFIQRLWGGPEPRPPVDIPSVPVAPTGRDEAPANSPAETDTTPSPTLQEAPAPTSEATSTQPDADRKRINLLVTSSDDFSSSVRLSKYLIVVVNEGQGDKAANFVFDDVFTVEKWKAEFVSMAESLRTEKVDPADVSIEIQVGKETPHRQIEKLLRLAREAGFRKTRIQPAKDKIKVKEVEGTKIKDGAKKNPDVELPAPQEAAGKVG